MSPIALWIDADPSGLVWTGLDCDDDLAILTALSLKETLSVVGLSICGGNAPLHHTWDNAQRLMDHVGSSIKPAQGYGWRSMQVSKRWLRILDWLAPDLQNLEDAADAIIQASHKISDLTVLTLGPPTNLARALIKDPSLATRLHRVVMMGGELTNQRLDLNFATDRGAARTVVAANVPVTLVPIQLCAQAILDAAFVSNFENECCPTAAACAILPKMKQQVALMPSAVNIAVAKRFPEGSLWKISPNIENGFIPWDIVAVLVISNPELFDDFQWHKASFPECAEGEPCGVTMQLEPFYEPAASDHGGVVLIPHKLTNEIEVLELMHHAMCMVPGMGPTPTMRMGFLNQIGTGIVATLVLLVLLVFRKTR